MSRIVKQIVEIERDVGFAREDVDLFVEKVVDEIRKGE